MIIVYFSLWFKGRGMWLILIVNMIELIITMKIHLWVCLTVFSEGFNWRGKAFRMWILWTGVGDWMKGESQLSTGIQCFRLHNIGCDLISCLLFLLPFLLYRELSIMEMYAIITLSFLKIFFMYCSNIYFSNVSEEEWWVILITWF